MRAHLLPYLAWSSRMSLSSSGVKAPFLRLGLRWLAQRSLQLLPQRAKPEFLCTAFQFPSPCFLTYSTRIASSAAVHGPFFNVAPPSPLSAPPVLDPPPSLVATPPVLFLVAIANWNDSPNCPTPPSFVCLWWYDYIVSLLNYCYNNIYKIYV